GVRLLNEAVRLCPDSVVCWKELARAYRHVGRFDRAEEAARRVIELQPDDTEHKIALAGILAMQNRIEEAESIYRDVIRQTPENTKVRGRLAHLLEAVHRLDDAKELAEEQLALDANNPHAVSVLAKCLRRQGKLEEAFKLCDEAVKCDPRARRFVDLDYEFARILDEMNRPDAAYERVELASQLQKQLYSGAIGEHSCTAQAARAMRERLESSWVEQWSDLPNDGVGEPLAVLCGFPRSGTTLLERSIAAHRDVTSFEEKPTFSCLQARLSQTADGYPDGIATMTEVQRGELRQTYRALLSLYSSELGAACLLDKLPLHTINIPLIYRIFPRAKLLVALRHPCDVILSCYMQHFSLNGAMINFNSLQDAARLYVDTMNIWIRSRELWPLQALEVRYEDSVNDFESQLRNVLSFLNLPWCGEILQAKSRTSQQHRVNTPSYHQIARPIYKTSVDRWRRYAKYFQPLEKDLRPLVERFGYHWD
ncbi:MAG: tetratricopeptide (TPR) repeat protein, partial [Pirellulaceae bacterium]